MCGHIVGSFNRMRVQRVRFRHETIEPVLEILLRAGIRVLLNEQACGRVSDKQCDQPLIYSGTVDQFYNFVRDVLETLAT